MNSSSQEYMDSDLIFIYLFSHLFFFSTWGRNNCFGLLKALMLRSEFKIAIVKKNKGPIKHAGIPTSMCEYIRM